MNKRPLQLFGTILLIGAGLLLVLLIISSASKPLPAGLTREDTITVRESGIKDEGEWLVTTVLTNAHGVNLVKLMSPKETNDNDFARYAVATDSSVTNGVMVKLVQVFDRHPSTAFGQINRGYLAIPIEK